VTSKDTELDLLKDSMNIIPSRVQQVRLVRCRQGQPSEQGESIKDRLWQFPHSDEGEIQQALRRPGREPD